MQVVVQQPPVAQVAPQVAAQEQNNLPVADTVPVIIVADYETAPEHVKVGYIRCFVTRYANQNSTDQCIEVLEKLLKRKFEEVQLRCSNSGDNEWGPLDPNCPMDTIIMGLSFAQFKKYFVKNSDFRQLMRTYNLPDVVFDGFRNI